MKERNPLYMFELDSPLPLFFFSPPPTHTNHAREKWKPPRMQTPQTFFIASTPQTWLPVYTRLPVSRPLPSPPHYIKSSFSSHRDRIGKIDTLRGVRRRTPFRVGSSLLPEHWQDRLWQLAAYPSLESYFQRALDATICLAR
jgi:hypothetical protein